MSDRDKILKAWERCNKCIFPSLVGDQTPYLECEYTLGLHCRQDKLIMDTIRFIESQPEIVRCKDCKHAKVQNKNEVWCCFVDDGFSHEPDWFCADGERRTDNA